MQTRNKMLDDFSQLMTNAMGVAQGAKEEAENAFASMVDRWLADRDFVPVKSLTRLKQWLRKLEKKIKILKHGSKHSKANSF